MVLVPTEKWKVVSPLSPQERRDWRRELVAGGGSLIPYSSARAIAARDPYGQNIRRIISLCLKNSDEPEKNRFFALSVDARRPRVHFAAMPAGFVNQLLRGVQFDDCENTNRGCMGHRYAMGSDAGLYYRLGRPRASVTHGVSGR